MEQFGEKNLEKQKPITFSFEFDTYKKEAREEYQGINITFWTQASEDRGRVDIVINVSPGRGERKELEGMKVILKQHGETVSEDVIKGGLVTFENRERGIYTVEFTLKEIKMGRDFDTFIV